MKASPEKIPDPVALINSALEKKQDGPILHFGPYQILAPAGGGSQGSVFKARNSVGRLFAIKIVKPPQETVDDHSNFRKRSEQFLRELRFLAQTNHRNIVQVITGGHAMWDAANGWVLKESTKNRRNDPAIIDRVERAPGAVFYNVMGYSQFNLEHVMGKIKSTKDAPKHLKLTREPLELFQKALLDTCAALAVCHKKSGHKKPVYHRDIQARNILYNPIDESFILADFGIIKSRHADGVSPRADINRHRPGNLAFEAVGNYAQYDISTLALVLQEFLEIQSVKQAYDPGRVKGFKAVFDKTKTPPGYDSVEKFCADLKPYLLEPRQFVYNLHRESLVWPPSREFIFTTKIRLPVSGSININEEVERIIDCEDFQRMRGVFQLGPTYLVYPGATHTRFEHSLGVYALTLRYLEVLTRLPVFRKICDGDLSGTVKQVVLAALLHDIGHYPYSHWIEEMGTFPRGAKIQKHEERAATIIRDGKLKKLIEQRWKVSVDDVCNLITGNDVSKPRNSLLNSIISSVIDVDKLDYLTRDSVHCGVPYGEGVDTDRFLDSLCIKDDALEPKVAVTVKGEDHVKTLLACRNTMYRTIYWHKTVRAATAMFKTAIYELLDKELLDKRTLERYFRSTDSVFISQIARHCRARPLLQDLLAPFNYQSRRGDEGSRKLYKTLMTITNTDADDRKCGNRAKRKAILEMKFQELTALKKRLVKKLRRAGLKGIEDTDILLENTPSNEIAQAELPIWDEREGDWAKTPLQVRMFDELPEIKKVYVFYHPRWHNAREMLLREVTAMLPKCL